VDEYQYATADGGNVRVTGRSGASHLITLASPEQAQEIARELNDAYVTGTEEG